MIYLIRHGETVGNAGNRYQTSAVLLNDQGHIQAKIRAETLRNKAINKIVTSPYTRAQQTAKIIQTELGLSIPIDLDDNLREMKHPSILEGRLKTDPDIVQLKTEIDSNRLNPLYRHSDEETLFMLYDRVMNLLDSLVKDVNTVLITHGGLLRMVLSYIQTQGDAHASAAHFMDLDIAAFPLNNAAMLTLEYKNSKWMMHELHNIC